MFHRITEYSGLESSDQYKYPNPNYGPKMAVHWKISSEGISALVSCQMREDVILAGLAGQFCGLLFSWVSNLETRTTTNADSSTSLPGQKEGINKKKTAMPLASRFGIWLWIYNFNQGDIFFPKFNYFCCSKAWASRA